jgi:hypothetical protein
MPAKAGIHDFLCCDKEKSWISAYAGITMGIAEESIIRLPGMVPAGPYRSRTQSGGRVGAAATAGLDPKRSFGRPVGNTQCEPVLRLLGLLRS